MKKMHFLAVLTALIVFCTQPTHAQVASTLPADGTYGENTITVTTPSFVASGKAKFETNSEDNQLLAISVTLVNNTFSNFQGVLVKTSDGTEGDWLFPVHSTQTVSSPFPAGSYYVYIFPLGGSGTHTYTYSTGASSGSYTGQYAEWTNVNITSAITLTVVN